MPDWKLLESQTAKAMVADRNRLRQMLRSSKRVEAEGKPAGQQLQRLESELRRSLGRCESRARAVPNISYDVELADLGPAGGNRRRHPRPPGSDRLRRNRLAARSTQLPKICLDTGPRRRRADRPHAAAAHRRPQRGRADRRGTRLAAGAATSASRFASPTRSARRPISS